MKKTEEFNLISFESTHMAIKSEKLLKEVLPPVRIITLKNELKFHMINGIHIIAVGERMMNNFLIRALSPSHFSLSK